MSDVTPKARKWQRILLVASLGVNLLIAGALVGTFALGGPKDGPPRFDLTAGPITRAMEGDRREAVREALRNSGAFGPESRAQIRADSLALLAALRSEQFDEDAFRGALMRQRSRLQEGQNAAVEAVATQIEDMSFEERVAFADRLEEQMSRSSRPRENQSGN